MRLNFPKSSFAYIGFFVSALNNNKIIVLIGFISINNFKKQLIIKLDITKRLVFQTIENDYIKEHDRLCYI